MSSIPQNQGGSDWLEWRKSKVTASEAAVIMGCSPYDTVYSLWQKKTGRKPPTPDNPAMRRGRELEEPIRQWYEEQVNEFFPPEVVVNPLYNWCAASLDGISLDRKTILEIKTCNAQVFEEALDGKIPENHTWQGLHQLACVPQATCVEFIFYHQNNYARVILNRDEDKIAEMIAEEQAFYEINILLDAEPELSEKDYRDFTKNWLFIEDELRLLTDRVSEDMKKITEDTKRISELKKKLADESDDGNGYGRYFKLSKSYPKGRLDEKKMLADNIDIEKYRKPSSVRNTITRLKETKDD